MKTILNRKAVACIRFIKRNWSSVEDANIQAMNVHGVLWRRAIEDSADFVTEHLDHALVFPEKRNI